MQDRVVNAKPQTYIAGGDCDERVAEANTGDGSKDTDAASQDSIKIEKQVNLRLALAKWLYAARGLRPGLEDEGFYGEPNWDILLDLYIREQMGKRLSVSAACHSARVPPTTALRYVTILSENHWVERVPDTRDKRRNWLKLTVRGRKSLDHYFDRLLRRLADLCVILGQSGSFEVPMLADCLGQLRAISGNVQELMEQLQSHFPAKAEAE